MHFVWIEMEDELYYHLALPYLKNLGSIQIKKILDYYGSAKAFFKDSVLHRRNTFGRRAALIKPTISREVAAQIEQEMKLMEQHDISCCLYTDKSYPQRLRHCVDAPSHFFYKGDLTAFNTSMSAAIVGTRLATAYGHEAVKRILGDCKGLDLCIVSGLASGIDTAAHEEALQNGLRTVAVMGTGFNSIYPPSNRQLAQKIIERGGAVISEYPFYTPPDKQNFPKRNRIIAGMADATIVVETALKGGSIITAHIAHSYNRDVFAIPGPISNSTSEGCNELIRQNLAALITSGKNLIEMMGWDHTAKKAVQRKLFVELNDDERRLANLLQEHGELPIDKLYGELPDMTVSKTAGLLLQLELKGIIQCKPGKIYSLA